MFTKNVLQYEFGIGAINNLVDHVREGNILYLIDSFFKEDDMTSNLPRYYESQVFFINSSSEPTTEYIDHIVDEITRKSEINNIIAIGSGCTIDIGKAVSNLISNGGRAAEYQGWDLVKKPGIYKIAIPTLSGTGSETSPSGPGRPAHP